MSLSSTSVPDQGFRAIDEAYQRHLTEHTDSHERWLLAQTLYSASSRRGILSLLPIQNGSRVLDIGTGFGALALDLVVSKSVQVTAIDLDDEALKVAQRVFNEIQARDAVFERASVEFQHGDAATLRYPDDTFDFAIARYVYQHLSDPQGVTTEIKRVLKPGAHVCLIDTDDRYMLTFPDETGVFERLQTAFAKLQTLKGGDRFVGRKLASFLDSAGLEVLGTIIHPEAQFIHSSQGDAGLSLTLSRFREIRHDIVDHGIMTSVDYDNCVELFGRMAGQRRFHSNGQVIALARRPL